jgi:hypothetical protein
VEDESLESEESSPGAPRTVAIRKAKSAERSIGGEFILSELADYHSLIMMEVKKGIHSAHAQV